MRTIDWVDGKVVILDQTLLPHREVVVTVTTAAQLAGEIARLAVRGAMALGVAGALGVALAALRAVERGESLERALDAAAVIMTEARPTAVNLAWGVEQVLAVRDGGPNAILAAALAVRDADITANRTIGARGTDLLAGARRILTHCNAGALAGVECGTALSVIGALDVANKLELVYACETRPLLQGSRLTAWELGRAGIAHTVIVDGAAAGMIVHGRVDAVVVGADRIAANGDVVNKVGTLSHALAAARVGIPFVVAAPEATIDLTCPSGAEVPIEERAATEVLELGGARIAPAASTACNPAFDVTPADLVTAIVTEDRVITPSGQSIGKVSVQ
ncbi:S-methyl-5-thioribose-1-phosphate isomerase [Nocardia brasiliensis]|uniref:Methylthioribose-1-phosphate isomerase n=1 Tax=Nocardia brasiliensis (strain ATCC 700358 / HUJEG-1) TaxID=1133849 RepID=K0EZ22_NOCB7|nr:S-methyl-5-thioribose-1-phosphate isomerase [Nocardia brasiliensis]AFU02284.1 translation initiation factor, aIF-2BI family protein [Nocardia brasiliensis ATCC 700358]AHK61114.1 NobD [Nocardia brasiliensis ATCC 700358]